MSAMLQVHRMSQMSVILIVLTLSHLITMTSCVKLIAGGADAAAPAYVKWWQLFKSGTSETFDIQYKYLGSSGGKAWVTHRYPALKGITPVFVGSDTPMAQEDYKKFPKLQIFPIIGDAVAVVFNIPNMTELVLSRDALVKIFLGKIQYWDHDDIKRFNPDAELPHREIKPVVRREGAGTTEVFTTALSAFSQEWKKGPGIFYKPDLVDGINGEGPSRNWPDHGAKYFGWRTSGAAALVKAIPYSIGFLGIGAAYEWEMSIVTLMNEAGYRILPSKITDGAEEAMNYFADSMDTKRLTANIVNGPSNGAYPIPNLSYFIVNTTTSPDVTCDQMKMFVRLVYWILNDPESIAAVKESHLVPLSSKMVKQVEKNVLAKLTCTGQNILAAIAKEDKPSFFTATNIAIIAAVAVVLIILLVLILAYAIRKWRFEHLLMSKSWLIEWVDLAKIQLVHLQTGSQSFHSVSSTESRQQQMSERSVNFASDVEEFEGMWKRIGNLDQQRVLVMFIKRETNVRIRQKENLLILSTGLAAIHNSLIDVHGHLLVSNCLIDSRWTVKLTDYGVNQVVNELYEQKLTANIDIPVTDFITLAPEILVEHAAEKHLGQCKGTKAADVYSLGMVLYQLLFRQNPFDMDSDTGEDILRKLQNPNEYIRPKIPADSGDVNEEILEIIQACWKRDPELRPNIKQIQTVVLSAKTDRSSKNIVEHVMKKMEKYAENLEKVVKTRTNLLQEERQRADELLSRMLPKSIAEKLKSGTTVMPQIFDSVTVFFSDVVGFTTLCSMSTPVQIVNLLNEVYTIFDGIIDSLDCYKVETIGDAYLVVSGLPQKNGFRHVVELGKLSTKLIETLKTYTVPHLPTRSLEIRIGMHSGSVAAGVVGLAMPHYCLFGDTVNMASRMETSGKPMHIHISAETKELVQNHAIGLFHAVYRGQTEIKGKGSCATYWLLKVGERLPAAQHKEDAITLFKKSAQDENSKHNSRTR